MDRVPVGQRCDNEAGGVAQVLVRVQDLRIANVGEAVLDLVVPAMAELRQPHEGLRAVHLLQNHLGHHITCVDVNGAHGHDLLTVAFRQIPDQPVDERVQLLDLLRGSQRSQVILGSTCPVCT